MKKLAAILILGSVLAGCATNARYEGAALPRDASTLSSQTQGLDPQLLPDRDRSRSWSVRDFMQPRGLLY